VLCLGSMLHSIATGNMLPSWVKIVCVDINPAVATKVSDRGTGQAVGVVTDVGLFLDLSPEHGHRSHNHEALNTPTNTPNPASRRPARNRNLAQPVPRLRNRNRHPEFTSVCPKTGLPRFRHAHPALHPDRRCLELKSLKMYMLAYRNLGIFKENVVNRFLDDIVKACDPLRAEVVGDFTPRGGLSTLVTATYERKSKRNKRRGS
jgi:7-cyano-7-deazaguanine reductase